MAKNDVSVFVKHAACTAHISLLYLELKKISQQPNFGFCWTWSGAVHQALGYFQAVEMQLGWNCWAQPGQGLGLVLDPGISLHCQNQNSSFPPLGSHGWRIYIQQSGTLEIQINSTLISLILVFFPAQLHFCCVKIQDNYSISMIDNLCPPPILPWFFSL